MTAETGHGSDTGTMDIREQQKTWHGFLGLLKWQIVFIALVLVFLAIFRTHT